MAMADGIALPGSSLDAEGLARQGRALRRLAVALVRDEDAAADLVQETWLAALRSPPDPERPLRPWLFEILRNFARMTYRRRRRREQREQAFATAAPGEPPSPEVALGRAQLLRLVADLALGLQEPYRSTVLLRYFEGRSAAEIAAAQGIPAATVRGRARDGLELLRAELDRRHGGDRASWRLLLLPLAGGAGASRPTPSQPAPGAPLLAAAAVLAAGTLALTAAWWLRRSPPDVPALAPALAGSGPAPARPSATSPPAPRSRAPATLRGLVRSAAGPALAGARVVLVRSDQPAGPADARAAQSTQAGFAFGDLPPGRYDLSASAPGFRSATRAGVFLRPGVSARVDLDLEAGGLLLQGRVLDSSRVPVTGALVQTVGSTPVHALTDDAGAFSVNLAPGTHLLRADASGFAESTQSVQLDSDATTDFFLEPAAHISGRVVLRASGRPLPEATVILHEPGTNTGEPLRATSDADGQFELGRLHAGRYQLFARAGELVGRIVDPIVVAAASRLSGLVLALEPGASLAGVVRDRAARPLPGVRVSVGLKVMPGVWAHSATDGAGRFQLNGLLPGPGWLVARADGFLSLEQPLLEIARGAPAALDLTLEPGARLEGRVLDAGGAPVAGAAVLAIDGRNTARGSARSGPDGSFRIANLVPGRLTIQAVHPDPARADAVEGQVQLAPNGRAALDLQLARPASASGRVDWQDGAPAAGVIVSATRMEGSLMRKSAKTDTGGRFQLAPLAPGRWLLDARLNIMRIAQAELTQENPGRRTFDLAPGQSMQAITLTIAHLDRELRGTVVDPEGRPLAGAIVSARPLDAGGLPVRDNAALMAEAEKRYQVTTGPDGTFRIGQLPEASLRITAEHPAFARPAQDSVPAGARDLRLQMAR